MNESELVVETLKAELRRQGLTYQDLGKVLELSHASVKRLFAERNFTLDRLEAICQFIGLDMAELFRVSDSKRQRLQRLTLEQEKLLISDSKLLCIANSLLNHWAVDEVLEAYAFTEHEVIRALAKLDKLKLIELLPGNRYKLLVARNFQWLINGPIQKFFEQQLQADFFNASFDKTGERRIFISASLSQGGIEQLNRILIKAAEDINAVHQLDEALPVGQRGGVSVVLAARPWEAKAFSVLRRRKAAAGKH